MGACSVWGQKNEGQRASLCLFVCWARDEAWARAALSLKEGGLLLSRLLHPAWTRRVRAYHGRAENSLLGVAQAATVGEGGVAAYAARGRRTKVVRWKRWCWWSVGGQFFWDVCFRRRAPKQQRIT